MSTKFGPFKLMHGNHSEDGPSGPNHRYTQGTVFYSKSDLLKHNQPGYIPKFVKVQDDGTFAVDAPLEANQLLKDPTLEQMSVEELKQHAQAEEIAVPDTDDKALLVDAILRAG